MQSTADMFLAPSTVDDAGLVLLYTKAEAPSVRFVVLLLAELVFIICRQKSTKWSLSFTPHMSHVAWLLHSCAVRYAYGRFLPHDAMLSAVYAVVVCLSVRPSVCVCVCVCHRK